jgi:hypothetical protein
MLKRLVKCFLRCFRDWIGTVPNPGTLRVSVTGEYGMGLRYKVLLPTGDDQTDVVGGRLTHTNVMAGVSTTATIDTALGQTEVDGLVADQDTEVSLSFTYVDDAGNVSSTPSVLTLMLQDTIPPANPGMLGVEITGET